MSSRTLGCVAAFACVAVSLAKPQVLIVQKLSNAESSTNVPVGMKLVVELDQEGRVTPVLWSMTDETFRAAIESGRIPKYVSDPDEKAIRDYAGRLGVDYVLIVEAVATKGVVRPQATLFDGGLRRTLWAMQRDEKQGSPRVVVTKDGKVDEEETKALREKYASILADGSLATMTVTVNGEPDWESTAATLARTWNSLLSEGPFKSLQPQRRVLTPESEPSLTFRGPNIYQAAPSVAIEDALTQARSLLEASRPEAALLVLRDAIDTAPFDARPRIELISVLTEQGFYDLAAREALRALDIAPDQVELWSLAADAWIQAGDVDRALSCANEAAARGDASFEVMQVFAEVWLLKGDYAKATEAYDGALAKEASQRAYLGRSVSRAMSGDGKGSIEDLDEARAIGDVDLQLYQRAMGVMSRYSRVVTETLKEIARTARIGEIDKAVELAESTQSTIAAIVEILVRIQPPSQHVQSHEARDLAYKLLKQSSVEALAFARSGNEDSAMESAISLGEALKLIPQIEEQFRIERKYPAAPKTN